MKKAFNPEMHSAEHILNQTMNRMFDCGRCFSAHIEKKKSKCDYHFQRNLSEDEVKEIEKCVNNTIDAELTVTEEYISLEEARRCYYVERLPSNTGDKIRIVKIGNYDACPCIGPHVSNTKQIGGFRITSTSFDNGVLRIRFKLSIP
jgi:Ser-tRNA(Ala) deacylase AlaX